jgi:2C-methyl-D-erythritol 2,4-cyclodiphosphate synthase
MTYCWKRGLVAGSDGDVLSGSCSELLVGVAAAADVEGAAASVLQLLSPSSSKNTNIVL